MPTVRSRGRRSWRNLSAATRLSKSPFFDSNFLVDVKRALAIARGIVASGVRFRWDFQASTDFLWKMSDDEVRLLGASGVTHMGFGTESASKEVLKLMNKHHQRVEQMVETARKAESGRNSRHLQRDSRLSRAKPKPTARKRFAS